MKTGRRLIMRGGLLALLGAVCSSAAGVDRADIQSVADGNNAFAFDLYAKLGKEPGNFCFSPYSISAALAMTYGGARGGTADEMRQTLRLPAGAEKPHACFAELAQTMTGTGGDDRVKLLIANSLWPQKGHELSPDYLAMARRFYGADVEALDYAQATERARNTINTWVERRTESRIKNLIAPGGLHPATLLVLVNAIYFKGEWERRFDPARTVVADFLSANGAKKRVPMMRQKGAFAYNEFMGGALLEMPCAGRAVSMVFLLPERPERLPRVEAELNAENLKIWLDDAYRREVDVWLPRFKVEWGTTDLKSALNALGMRMAFQPGVADFSGLGGARAFFIDAVFHKALVEVNEAGAEAAAATAVVMGRSASMALSFKVDRPFIFLIRNNTTGSILFMGRVMEPLE